MQASEVMVRDVVTIRPEATVRDVAQLLIEKRISGAPVADAEGGLVGIITESDLLRRAEIGTDQRRSRWLEFFIGPEVAADEFVKAHGLRVADVMTRSPVSVTEGTDLREIADVLERNRIRRVPVLRDGKVVGIISRSNLVQALASLPSAGGERSSTDRELQERVFQAIRSQPFGMPWLVSAVVSDGVVDLWGTVSSEAERRTVRVAVEAVPGVREIRNNLTVRPVSYAAE